MRPGSPFVLRKLHAIAPQPWKNGGGVTRELAHGAGWRISVADVAAAGPFSIFSGQRRHSVAIDDAGLDLHGAAGHLSLDPLRCVSYDGGLAWQATLRAGAARVFNVTTVEGEASAQLLVSPALATAPDGGLCLALCLGEGLGCLADAASPFALAPGDFLLFGPTSGPVRFESTAAGAGILVACIAPGPGLPQLSLPESNQSP